jgi:hypothetical protein
MLFLAAFYLNSNILNGECRLDWRIVSPHVCIQILRWTSQNIRPILHGERSIHRFVMARDHRMHSDPKIPFSEAHCTAYAAR